MIQYSLIKRKNSLKPIEDMYVVQTKASGKVTLNEIAESIEKGTTFTKGEVQGIINIVAQHVTDALLDGNTVELGDLGTFEAHISAHSTTSAKSFSIRKYLRRVNVRFLPSVAMKLRLKNEAEFCNHTPSV